MITSVTHFLPPLVANSIMLMCLALYMRGHLHPSVFLFTSHYQMFFLCCFFSVLVLHNGYRYFCEPPYNQIMSLKYFAHWVPVLLPLRPFLLSCFCILKYSILAFCTSRAISSRTASHISCTRFMSYGGPLEERRDQYPSCYYLKHSNSRVSSAPLPYFSRLHYWYD